jgi:ferric-dicitrate binding protein FerR (iron transport regulator)
LDRHYAADRAYGGGARFRPRSGRVGRQRASGAQILLEGPVSVRLDSTDAAHLFSGRIATKVPTHAIGFVVTSPLARFVDLGTAFTLKMDPEEAFEIYVFEGLVKVEVDERFGEVVAQPLRVAEVHAIQFDVKKANFAKLPFNQGEQMPF